MTFNIFKNKLLVNIGPLGEKVLTNNRSEKFKIIKKTSVLQDLEMTPDELHMAFNKVTANILAG
jgi:hypothetical protein